MRLTHLALKRPIAVSMIFLAMGLVGFLSWQRLPLELIPNLNYPQLTVVANCENFFPLEMEALVTKPLESSLGTVGRIRKINSISREGVSLITLDFDWGTNMNYASLDVREKLDQVRDLLPKEATTPMIIRYDPASLPIMTLAIKEGSLKFEDLQELVSGVIKRELERVGGVASARLSGAREREIRVAVHPERLLAQKLSISALVDALKEANLNFPGGKISQHDQELSLRVVGEFKKLSDLGQVGLWPRQDLQNEQAYKGGLPAFVREVAEVQDTFKEERSIARLDGKSSLILSIFKMADANTVQVVDRLKARVAALNQEYGGRLQITVAQDQGHFIQQAIAQLEEAALLGGLLAFGVLFGFLASFSSALIIMTAIPVSILATFSLMHLAGISLNMMSLGGLALGIGMLVDNGVVVLENIRRHQELGEVVGPAAIVQGTDEVKMAVTASTFAHMVVFLPVIFVAGIAGQFLYQVGLTISFSLLTSLAVALILNPMLVSLGTPWVTKDRAAANSEGSWAGKLKDRLDRVYARRLAQAFQHRRRLLTAAVLLTAFGVLVLLFLGRELLPALDQREFLLRVSTPPNTALDTTSERLKTIEDLLLAHPGVQTVITQLGYNPKEQYEKVLEEKEPRVGTVTVTLKPRNQYAKTARAIVDEIRPRLSQLPDTKIDYIFPQSLGQWLSQKPQLPELLTFQGPELEVLENLAQTALVRLKEIPGLRDLQTSLKKDNQESRVVLDRERAASFGLSLKDIGETLKVSIQGEVSTQFRQADKDIDIRVQLMGAKQKSLPELAKIYIYSKLLKTQIPLQEVARIETGPGLTEVQRRDQERLVAIQGNVVGRSAGEAQEDIKQALKTMELPPGYTLVQSGEALEMGRSFKALFWALMLSVLLVYMILAGQFESLLNPLIILFAVPFSLVGVALTLWLTGWGISMGVYFGAIMLGGIVVNNSILLIDYTNTLRRQGFSLTEAVFQGSRARLRPIVMTTLTTSLGLLPLVLNRGEGAELRVPLALTVLGGLIASTFLTLILVPLLYLFSEEKLAGWRRRKSLP